MDILEEKFGMMPLQSRRVLRWGKRHLGTARRKIQCRRLELQPQAEVPTVALMRPFQQASLYLRDGCRNMRARKEVAKGPRGGATRGFIATAPNKTMSTIEDDVDGVHATIAASIRGALPTIPRMKG
jgi:hypothetical protein